MGQPVKLISLRQHRGKPKVFLFLHVIICEPSESRTFGNLPIIDLKNIGIHRNSDPIILNQATDQVSMKQRPLCSEKEIIVSVKLRVLLQKL